MKKFVLVFGLLFFIFSSFFLSPMFLMGIVLMPVAIHIWIILLLPMVLGGINKNAYSKK